MIGSDAGDQVRPPGRARDAAAGRVDDRRAIRRRVQEHVARAVDVDDVGTRDQDVDRAGRCARSAMPPTLQPPFSAPVPGTL